MATSAGYGGGDSTYGAAALSSDLSLLVNDVQAAYSDFLAEQNTFGAASWINKQLQAALYLSKADTALAAKVGASNTVRNNLLRLVAHLAVSEELLLYGGVSAGTQAQAAAAKARLDNRHGPADANYTSATPGDCPLSLGSVLATP